MSNYEELEKLAKLKEQWILSDDEFEIEKKKILILENKKDSNILEIINKIPFWQFILYWWLMWISVALFKYIFNWML
jgi:hypothetical protein